VEHLKDTDAAIAEAEARAEALSFDDLSGKDAVYQEVDKLKGDRDKKIEGVLNEILPEAFAVVKETARRFKKTANWFPPQPNWTASWLLQKITSASKATRPFIKTPGLPAAVKSPGIWCITMCS
jgi:preprotein translocase subunit SecA